ncbi:L,D-transpeptidase family protein [Actinomadura sp. LD22]|uniref:L,D-transpeptidase family protein n=1 Tax=Actinomadura physcomitrii TaxID=2650748 RepID=A0A6I4M1E9_9ACTN|nr:L,D-transpeptidase [Actinomadura physcomitrii]MVZ99121.1 L,D-transpeptidase family protein [Actinomadura physcomitrii]
MTARRTGTGGRARVPAVLAASALLAGAGALLGGCGHSPANTASAGGTGRPARAQAPAGAPEATTYARLKGVPRDDAPDGATGGLVVHPAKAVPVLDKPGGRTVATLPAQQLGGPTWVPVVQSSGDWRRVLLPSRPNGATGWISGAADGLITAHTPYTVKVDLSRRRLTLLKAGKPAGAWSVAVGGARTPTPTGRTFMLATLAPATRTPSPLVLPLGTHSATLDTFGGGPGTVALHGWPDRSVFGKAVTHGCVRVPQDALDALAKVPLGSLVFIGA